MGLKTLAHLIIFFVPRLPHAFYPVQTDGYVQVSAGDKLAARCIMVNDQNHLITTGPKDSDEMCIFYVMYYVETDTEPHLGQVAEWIFSQKQQSPFGAHLNVWNPSDYSLQHRSSYATQTYFTFK